MNRLSIRKQLLTLFVPFLFGLWTLSAVLCFWLVSNFSHESFDRDLISSADSVVGRLRVKQGKIVVDLPPAAIAILKHDESDKFYYSVTDPDGKLISGDANLPPPQPGLVIDTPRVVDGQIANKNVRVAEIRVAPEEDGTQTVIVQVAETKNVRSAFLQKMFLSIAVPQLLVILLGLFAVWYGIKKILTPLKLLQEQVVNRTQFDLSALSDADTPEEVYPLVRALNQLLERLKEDIQVHQRFIANAAHQLRTPLAGLKTYSSIGTEMSDTQELQHIVQELDSGIDRASRIVTQLLALARTDGVEPNGKQTKSMVDLNFVVSEVTSELIDQAIRKGLELTCNLSPTPATIGGEEMGLRNLVSNLVENAILYTEPGGQVTVELVNKRNPILTVTDTGPGIPMSERPKVFERFHRVPGIQKSGSGLGLAIVQEVAHVHKAQVTIESGRDGQGTSFIVEFPQTVNPLAS
jgi:two-component system sensor histidine kinase TctE